MKQLDAGELLVRELEYNAITADMFNLPSIKTLFQEFYNRLDSIDLRLESIEGQVRLNNQSLTSIDRRVRNIEISVWHFSPNWKVAFSRDLDTYFNEVDLMGLALWLNLDWENIEGKTKKHKIMSLLSRVEQLGLQQATLDYCLKERPLVDWTIPDKGLDT